MAQHSIEQLNTDGMAWHGAAQLSTVWHSPAQLSLLRLQGWEQGVVALG